MIETQEYFNYYKHKQEMKRNFLKDESKISKQQAYCKNIKLLLSIMLIYSSYSRKGPIY